MRGAPTRSYGHRHRALGAGGKPSLGGLAVDQKTTGGGERIRRSRAVRALLLSDHEQQIDAILSGVDERLCGNHHRGGDALRVAGAASSELCTLQRGTDEGWNGIQVRGKGDGSVPARRPNVGVTGRELLVSDAPASLAQPSRGELDGGTLRSGQRWLSDERMRELDDVGHRHNLSHPPGEGETVRARGVYHERSRGTGDTENRCGNVLTAGGKSASFLLPNKTRITAVTPHPRRHDVADRISFAGCTLQWLTSTAFQR